MSSPQPAKKKEAKGRGTDHDDARRRREVHTVQIRKTRQEEQIAKHRKVSSRARAHRARAGLSAPAAARGLSPHLSPHTPSLRCALPRPPPPLRTPRRPRSQGAAAPEAHEAPAPLVHLGDIPALANALMSPHLGVDRMCEVTMQFRKILSIGAS